MYIELFGRGDRLGANITTFIAQIIYAHNNKLYIKYDRTNIVSGDNVRFVPYNQKYNSSIFIETLFDFIDIHNTNMVCDNELKIYTIHFFEMISLVTLNIKIDQIYYFKQHILNKIIDKFLAKAIIKKYDVPFNPKKTILVHLRLDDVRGSGDYDGNICANHFRKNIDNDIIANNDTHYEITNRFYCNSQAPLSIEKLQHQINLALQKYPDYEVILITNPGENTDKLPYKCIKNSDESLDLFLLCNSNVVILSRSTYALSCLYFGIATDVYLPLWGHIPCFGLYTKYDNCNYNYFS